jgi:tRNA threonylcarbamoyladenosine biosynthesis protein TsaE
MNLWTHTFSLDNITDAAQLFLSEFSGARIFCFSGDLGSGKTTFIAALVKAFKSEDMVHSPTFSLVNEYLTIDGNRLYHFDFYRLKSDEEAFESGLMELIDSGNLCFIEWPSRALNILPEDFINVEMHIEGNNRKMIAKKLKE